MPDIRPEDRLPLTPLSYQVLLAMADGPILTPLAWLGCPVAESSCSPFSWLSQGVGPASDPSSTAPLTRPAR